MLMSVFTVTLIAFFVLTVWFEVPREPVRRPKDQPTEVDDVKEAA